MSDFSGFAGGPGAKTAGFYYIRRLFPEIDLASPRKETTRAAVTARGEEVSIKQTLRTT
jgi:hypothetical protein